MKDSIRSVIRERRSIRSFRNEDIPTDLLLELLQDASFAPNHKLREPWSFILFKDNAREKLCTAALKKALESEKMKSLPQDKQVEKITKMKTIYQNCPAHILVLCNKSEAPKVQLEDFAATSAFIQNFQLLSWEKGIGMVWKTPVFMEEPSFRAELGVDPEKMVVGLLHIGYPMEIPKLKDRSDIKTKVEIRD
jgi:nitroreductase